ncbi:hypothetical protein [Hymenobacter cavernae]|uniref:DUF4199 domain-containing protein n=1 Tax=Hymenobacter cavernae TaxID=2044852 RepID=A0ABQ1UG31_9BACT|nr:hypothetical protein [Hymenobacter cavernae]GGF18281.1 hypothetical protein GCM10011383_32200 [Hymenobacter cavernae]
MRYAMLVCWLLNSLLALPIQAQTATDSINRAARLAPTVTHTRQDSIRAVQRLFHVRRRTGTWFIVGGTIAGATIAILYAATSAVSSVVNFGYPLTNQAPPKVDNTGYVGAGVVVGIGTVIPAIVLKTSFNRAKEKALLQAYEQGKPMPADIRNALHDKFFR